MINYKTVLAMQSKVSYVKRTLRNY